MIINGIKRMIKNLCSRHKSNELVAPVEIESQLQSNPPSPNPPTIAYASPFSMFLDTDLKFPHIRYVYDSPGLVPTIWSKKLLRDVARKKIKKKQELYLTSSTFSATLCEKPWTGKVIIGSKFKLGKYEAQGGAERCSSL